MQSDKKLTMRIYFTTIFYLFILNLGFSQVELSTLSENPVLTHLFENGKLQKASYNAEKSVVNNPIHLPFIDDFSKNHQPGASVVLWEDNFAFINPTYGSFPPTIGVATFDGLDFNGYPYNFESPTSYGEADVLTSCPINLSEDENGDAYTPGDSIYMSFYYQPQGLGDQPEVIDSLILEFYDAETDSWTEQWAKPGQSLTSFYIVFIPIIDDIYFSPDFRFRFRNKATLSGNLDHWNIDMVWIDKNRTSVNQNGFADVGFQFPVNQMLNGYTSMPYSHYQLNSSSYMIDLAPAQLRNNNSVAINLSNVKMLNYSEGNLVNETPFPGNIENFPPLSSASYAIPVYNGNSGYVFDPNIDEPFVSFNNEFVMTSGTFDLVKDNDTITYVQKFENYYSYDDGSAEAGIGLNVNGGRLINKFQSIIGDSLIAFKMYFNPITNNPVYPFFKLVYNDEDGVPELIHIDQSFSEVQFVQEGHDIFAYYWLDSAVYVNGSFYIGISQTSQTSLNLGFDKNIDTHENIYYNIGLNWVQLSDSFEGSLMMRPVFQSEMDSIILGIDDRVELFTQIYPNPANSTFTIKCNVSEGIDMEVFGIDGRSCLRERFYENTKVNVEDFSEGLYIIRLRSNSGLESIQKIIVRH